MIALECRVSPVSIRRNAKTIKYFKWNENSSTVSFSLRSLRASANAVVFCRDRQHNKFVKRHGVDISLCAPSVMLRDPYAQLCTIIPPYILQMWKASIKPEEQNKTCFRWESKPTGMVSNSCCTRLRIDASRFRKHDSEKWCHASLILMGTFFYFA